MLNYLHHKFVQVTVGCVEVLWGSVGSACKSHGLNNIFTSAIIIALFDQLLAEAKKSHFLVINYLVISKIDLLLS